MTHLLLFCFFFFFKQKTAYDIMPSLVGSEMCIRDRVEGAADSSATSLCLTVGETFRLENDLVLVEVDSDGELLRLYDKVRGREALAPGQRGNQLCAFEDRPLNWEAWDIESYFEERMWKPEAGSIRVLEEGPLRVTLEVERRLG